MNRFIGDVFYVAVELFYQNKENEKLEIPSALTNMENLVVARDDVIRDFLRQQILQKNLKMVKLH